MRIISLIRHFLTIEYILEVLGGIYPVYVKKVHLNQNFNFFLPYWGDPP